MANNILSLKCPDCGKKIAEDANICPHCGTNLDAPLGSTESHALAEQYLKMAQNSYERNGNIHDALENVAQAIEFEPESAEAHNLRGLILDALGKPNAAIKSYREAIRLNPYLEEAKANLEDAEKERQNGQLEPVTDTSDAKSDIWLKVFITIGSIVLVLTVLAALGSIYLLGRDYFLPKNTIIFEPDYSKVSAIDPSALQKTAEMLTERSRKLGYSNVTFKITANNQIVGKVPSYQDSKALIVKISPIGLLEFVDFGNTSIAVGTVIQTDYEIANPKQTDEKQWHTIMTNSGIKEAVVGVDSTQNYNISIALTEQATKIFSEYTTANIDTYLGIVMDKVVLSAPRIAMPITGGQAAISGSFTQESANNLAVLMRTTPLPIPIRLVQGADTVK